MKFFNRDSRGRFLSRPQFLFRTVAITLALVVPVYLLSETLVVVNTWSARHIVQKPYVLLTNQDNVLIQLIKQPVVVERKPLEVLSPFANSVVEAVDTSNLSDVEKEILAVFGEQNFKIARAVFKAESGLREDAFHANDNGSIDVGIGQINSIHFKREGCSFKELVDYKKNIACAKQIYDEQGWEPWVVFQTGAFRGNL